MRGRFTTEQVGILLRPIKPGRVYQQQGQSYVAGWDVSAHLTRMFGFAGWEKEVLELVEVFEEPPGDGRRGWTVTYRCQMALTVFDADGRKVWRNTDAATGTGNNQPQRGEAHDLAVKNAVTYALKRCAKDLGDQFGLSLYNKGSEAAVVGMTLVHGLGDEPDIDVDGEGDDAAEDDGAAGS